MWMGIPRSWMLSLVVALSGCSAEATSASEALRGAGRHGHHGHHGRGDHHEHEDRDDHDCRRDGGIDASAAADAPAPADAFIGLDAHVTPCIGTASPITVSEAVVPAGTTATQALAVDVDGDASPDLVTPVWAAHAVYVWIALGGSFAGHATYAVPGVPSSARVADLDEDGDVELLVTYDGRLAVFPGLGAGAFGPPISMAVGVGATRMDVGDLDADGHLDVAVCDRLGNQLVVLRGAGDLTLTEIGRYGIASGPSTVSSADVDEDGTLDLVVTGDSTRTVHVLLGVGDGSFSALPVDADGALATAAVLARLDCDEHLDLVMANYTTTGGGVRVRLGRGDGTFAPSTTWSAGTRISAVDVGDVDGDEVPDLIAGGAGGVVVGYGLGGGAFGADLVLSSASLPWNGIDVADLDGDGALDVVASEASALHVLTQ